MLAALGSVVVLVAVGCGGDDGGGAELPAAGVQEGQRITRRAGCTACHGADGEGGIGPAWAGSLDTEVELTDGSTVIVDEAFLARSIADPSAEVHAGFPVAMPENELTDEEITQVVAYIVSLNEPETGTTG
jgi:cytochrome c oxidase subunit 2